MSQKALGQNILLSSKSCLSASIRLGSRSTPASYALGRTNLNTWVITSLVKVLCPHQRKSRPFKTSQLQILAKNCASSSVWSISIVICGKTLLASCPINCLNLQAHQIRVERKAPKLFWCNQMCDMTCIISGLPILQCSVWNTYWCIQTTYWCSHIPKGQANWFLFTKD